MACIRNRVTQRIRIGVIYDRHPGIIAAVSDPHLGWAAPSAYQMICMRHVASNFMTRFKDKLLKNLVCRAALASAQRKFNKHMATTGRIISEAQQWLETIHFCKTPENLKFYKNIKLNNKLLKWLREA